MVIWRRTSTFPIGEPIMAADPSPAVQEESQETSWTDWFKVGALVVMAAVLIGYVATALRYVRETRFAVLRVASDIDRLGERLSRIEKKLDAVRSPREETPAKGQ